MNKVLWLMTAFTYCLGGGQIGDHEGVIGRESCVIIVKKNCGFSNRARGLLKDEGVRCHIIEVEHETNAENFFGNRIDKFPTMFYMRQKVGGYGNIKYLADRKLPPFNGKSKPDYLAKQGSVLH